MARQASFDTASDGARDASEPLEIGPATTPVPVEELRVRRPGLDSGRHVELESPGDGTDRLTVRSPSGEVELSVTLTAAGPVLRFEGAELELAATGRLGIRAEEVDIHARRKIRQVSEGDLEQHVFGDAELAVTGDLATKARSTRIESRRGEVQIRANDEVRLLGERVKLNC